MTMPTNTNPTTTKLAEWLRDHAEFYDSLISGGSNDDNLRRDVVMFRAAADLIDQQAEVIGRLPQTADGVTVLIGDTVYAPSGRKHRVLIDTMGWNGPSVYYVPEAINVGGEWRDLRASECYSTYEAAERAAGEGA